MEERNVVRETTTFNPAEFNGDLLGELMQTFERYSKETPLKVAKTLGLAFSAVNRNAGRKDGYAEAVVRGLAAKESFKIAEGGSVSAEEGRRFLHNISKTTLLTKHKKGELLAWKEGRAFRFPVWQFAPGGGLLAGISDTLAILNTDPDMDDWAKILFFLNKRGTLAGDTVLTRLKAGELETVLKLARAEVTF